MRMESTRLGAHMALNGKLFLPAMTAWLGDYGDGAADTGADLLAVSA